jgi:hypothetical protein
MTADSQRIDEVFRPCDIAACCSERFGKGAHENVDGAGRNIEVIADTASVRSNRSNRVSFVDEKEELD